MSIIPQIIIPLAFASLIQHIFFVSQLSGTGLFIVFATLLSWYFFVTRTKRGRVVYNSWIVNVEQLDRKAEGNANLDD